MNAQELVAEAEGEINVFERPSRSTSIALVAMVKLQADRIAELEKQTVESFLNSGFVLPKRSKSDFYAPAYNEAVQDMIAKLKEYINKDG